MSDILVWNPPTHRGPPRVLNGRAVSKAEIIWTADDMLRFAAKATELEREHLIDGLRLAAVTGLRRSDLVALTWPQVANSAIVRQTLKPRTEIQSCVAPRLPALKVLLRELRARYRKAGVETVLVNNFGQAWRTDDFGENFKRVRDAAEIAHLDEESGRRTKKRLCDVRSNFCIRLLIDAHLNDTDAAGIMGWTPERVAALRRICVEQSDVVTRHGERMLSLS